MRAPNARNPSDGACAVAGIAVCSPAFDGLRAVDVGVLAPAMPRFTHPTCLFPSAIAAVIKSRRPGGTLPYFLITRMT